MARIPSSEGMGEVVARPRRYSEAQTPRSAFGAGPAQALTEIGADMARRDESELEQARHRAEVEQRRAEHEARQSREQADRAQALGRMHAAQETLAALHDEFGASLADGSLDKTKAAEEWQRRSREEIEQALKDVPESHRTQVQMDLDLRSQRLARGVQRAVVQRDRADVRSGILQTREYAQRLYATNPQAADALYAQTLQQLGPHGGLTEEQVSKDLQAWREGAQYTTGYSMVSAAKHDAKALDAAEKRIESLEYLDPQKRAELTDRIGNYRLAIQQKAEIAAARAQRLADAKLNQASKVFDAASKLSLDGTLNADFADQVRAQISGTPFAGMFETLLKNQAKTGPLAAQPMQVLQTAVDALNAQASRDGISPELKERRDTVQRALDAQRRDVSQEGGLRAWSKRGAFEAPPPLQMTSDLPSLVGQLATRVPLAQQASRLSGRPESLLYPEEAEALNRTLDALPAKQKAGFVARLSAAVPMEQAVALAEQVDKRDRALALALKAGTNQTSLGRMTSELVLAGAQAMKDQTSTKGKKEPEVVAGKWKASIAEKLGDVFADQRTADDFRDMALLIAHGKAAEAGGSVNIDEAVNLALHGSLAEGRGRTVVRDGRPFRVALPLPVGMDESALDDKLRALTPNDLAADQVIAGGVPMKTTDFLRALPGQELVPVRPGVYSVIVGGRPVLRHDGKQTTRLEIKVR